MIKRLGERIGEGALHVAGRAIGGATDAMIDATDHLQPKVTDAEQVLGPLFKGWKDIETGPWSGSVIVRADQLGKRLENIEESNRRRPILRIRQRVSHLRRSRA